ncbi:MAG: hypothetical protein ACREKL_05670 [Chthoniobacterales bacterium]
MKKQSTIWMVMGAVLLAYMASPPFALKAFGMNPPAPYEEILTNFYLPLRWLSEVCPPYREALEFGYRALGISI